MSKIIKIIMKNLRLRLCNLMMYHDGSLVRHQQLPYVAAQTLSESCDVAKTSTHLVAKEDDPFRERL